MDSESFTGKNIEIDWWFSVPNLGSEVPLPVQTIYKTDLTYIYDYAEFPPYLEDVEAPFQTPQLMFCQNRKSTKRPPRTPNSFSAKIEIVEPQNALNPNNLIEDNQVFISEDLKL